MSVASPSLTVADAAWEGAADPAADAAVVGAARLEGGFVDVPPLWLLHAATNATMAKSTVVRRPSRPIVDPGRSVGCIRALLRPLLDHHSTIRRAPAIGSSGGGFSPVAAERGPSSPRSDASSSGDSRFRVGPARI